MSKRNIAYVKPQDPSFLRRLKEEIGYKDDGPTVDTKRQKFENFSDSDEDESGGTEKPQVVVLKAGDLTSEEADAEKARIEKEEIEKPADLNQRVIFSAKHKPRNLNQGVVCNTNLGFPTSQEDDNPLNDSSSSVAGKSTAVEQKEKKIRKKSSKKEAKTSKLSFAQDDEEEDF